MTPAEQLCKERGIDLIYFDGRGVDTKGFYNPAHQVIALDTYLDETTKKKVLYHELGHQHHDPSQYDRRREQYELQADRLMIHHLIKEELTTIDHIENFNYTHFMEKYQLNTMTNESMIKEEFWGIVGGSKI